MLSPELPRPSVPLRPAALKLTGTPNFRDAGGHGTRHGRAVRHGVLFRSAHLSRLTAEDCARLELLGIRSVFDLRTEFERGFAPTRWHGPGPRIVETAIGFERHADPTQYLKRLMGAVPNVEHAHAAMRAVSALIVIEGALGIGEMFRSFAAGQVPALVHCTAGKDRTGLSVAVLLTLLGVPEDAVYADYLRSNAELGPAPENNGMLPSTSRALPPEILRVLLTVDPSYLDAAFAAIRERYGSFDAYAALGLRLTAAEIEALHSTFME